MTASGKEDRQKESLQPLGVRKDYRGVNLKLEAHEGLQGMNSTVRCFLKETIAYEQG
jgi:hypothetical protein